MITNTQIIKAVFTPTLLYQSENWTLTSKERQMLTTTEMRCPRNAAGKTIMDKIRNKEIRRRINMQPAEQTANKNKIRWWSHIKRMAPTAPRTKQCFQTPTVPKPPIRHNNGTTADPQTRSRPHPTPTRNPLSTRHKYNIIYTYKI